MPGLGRMAGRGGGAGAARVLGGRRGGAQKGRRAACGRRAPGSRVALLATWPPAQADAVLLGAVLGLHAPTAGRVLGKRAGAVRTAAHRGLKTLHKKLDRAKEPPPAGVAPAAGAAQPAGVTQPARVTQTRGLTLKDVR